jgi:hypothetical protein
LHWHLLLLSVIPEAGVPNERFCSLGWEGNLALPFSSARQMYFSALPRLKPMCSVICMHSIPDL